MRRPSGRQMAILIAAIVVIAGIATAVALQVRSGGSSSTSLSGLEAVSETSTADPSQQSDPDAASDEQMAATEMPGPNASESVSDAYSASVGTEQLRAMVPNGATETTRTGATLVQVERVDLPESYEAIVNFAGWHTECSMPVVEVMEAELLGEIDPITGEQKAAPTAVQGDHSDALVGLWLMAEPTPEAAEELQQAGVYRVRLVLMPGEGAVVPRLDRAVREQ